MVRMTPDIIRALRARLGLSQAGLARALDAPTSTVIGWEQPEGTARHRKPDRRYRAALERLKKQMEDE